MSDPLLNCVEIEPEKPARAAVIWLHGLGADGHDFEPVVPELRLPEAMAVRFVFPHAPRRPVTINGGFVMPAWYDIYNLDREAREDEAGIRESARQLGLLIERERVRGIDGQRIVIAGFSQGGAVALHEGLRHREPLAGVMALSCYLPLVERVLEECSQGNRRTPIFMAHGTQDPTLPIDYGTAAMSFLKEHGYPVRWHTYPMGHALCPGEIVDIRCWLLDVLDS